MKFYPALEKCMRVAEISLIILMNLQEKGRQCLLIRQSSIIAIKYCCK